MAQINLWCGKAEHQQRILDFHAMIRRHPDFTFIHPNYKVAPWHVQALSQNGTVINFWPHKMKGQVIYHKAVAGLADCEKLFDEVRVADDEPDFSMFEG